VQPGGQYRGSPEASASHARAGGCQVGGQLPGRAAARQPQHPASLHGPHGGQKPSVLAALIASCL
jgi:hypothetical protein